MARPPADRPVIGVIGDVHARYDRLAVVLDHIEAAGAQGILLVGDLACCGHANVRSAVTLHRYRKRVQRVLAQVRERGLPFAFVPGNHDLPVVDEPENVDGRCVELAGLRVAGIGGAGPDIFGFAYEWTDEQLRQRRIPDADVLLCHAPPHGTAIDLTHGGQHVGSATIRALAERHHGVLVCGHIHEAPGMVRLGDCLCMNVGGLGAPFGRTRVGYLRGLDELVYEDLDAADAWTWTRDGAEVRVPSPI